jgi:hypothetical protein
MDEPKASGMYEAFAIEYPCALKSPPDNKPGKK